MGLKKVLDPITILPQDVDRDIARKISERIGREIRAIHWEGTSGLGVRGYVLLKVAGGGDPERVPFRAQSKQGVGGAFEVGDWIVPYTEFGYAQDPDILSERIDKKLSKDGNLSRSDR
jgi:hypothetical protein